MSKPTRVFVHKANGYSTETYVSTKRDLSALVGGTPVAMGKCTGNLAGLRFVVSYERNARFSTQQDIANPRFPQFKGDVVLAFPQWEDLPFVHPQQRL